MTFNVPFKGYDGYSIALQAVIDTLRVAVGEETGRRLDAAGFTPGMTELTVIASDRYLAGEPIYDLRFVLKLRPDCLQVDMEMRLPIRRQKEDDR